MPEIRARYLDVSLLGRQGAAKEYQVSDSRRDSRHRCMVYADTSTCDCTAASYGNRCAHQIAALLHHARKEPTVNNTPIRRVAPKKTRFVRYQATRSDRRWLLFWLFQPLLRTKVGNEIRRFGPGRKALYRISHYTWNQRTSVTKIHRSRCTPRVEVVFL